MRVRTKRFLLLTLAVVTIAVGGGAAADALTSPPPVVSACYHRTTGLVRVVDPTAEECRDQERAISWNIGAQTQAKDCDLELRLYRGMKDQSLSRPAGVTPIPAFQVAPECAPLLPKATTSGAISLQTDRDLDGRISWGDEIAYVVTVANVGDRPLSYAHVFQPAYPMPLTIDPARVTGSQGSLAGLNGSQCFSCAWVLGAMEPGTTATVTWIGTLTGHPMPPLGESTTMTNSHVVFDDIRNLSAQVPLQLIRR